MTGFIRAHYLEILPENIDPKFARMKKLFMSVNEILKFDYLRETFQTTPNPKVSIEKRKRPIFGEQHNGIIAYATIGRHSPYLFNVLIWWHKHHDRDVMPTGPYRLSPEHLNDPKWRSWGPCEAVPPERVMSFFKEGV